MNKDKLVTLFVGAVIGACLALLAVDMALPGPMLMTKKTSQEYFDAEMKATYGGAWTMLYQSPGEQVEVPMRKCDKDEQEIKELASNSVFANCSKTGKGITFKNGWGGLMVFIDEARCLRTKAAVLKMAGGTDVNNPYNVHVSYCMPPVTHPSWEEQHPGWKIQ